MKWLRSRISIQRLKPITWCQSITVDSSWRMPSDTATVMLPRDVQLTQGVDLSQSIRRGDTIKIDVGYNDRLWSLFTGYVSEAPKAMREGFRIVCEDEMFNLKQISASINSREGSVPAMLNKIIPNVQREVQDTSIGAFRMQDTNAAAMLAAIAERGVYSYFREGVLVVGDPYPAESDTVLLDFSANVQNTDLEFVRAEDIQLRVKAVSHPRGGGKKLTVTVPETLADGDSDTRTFNYVGLTESQLKARAEKELKRMRYSGYRGTLEVWGLPVVRHGNRVELRNDRYPEYNGAYLVDRVETRFGTSGIVQKIHLGPAS